MVRSADPDKTDPLSYVTCLRLDTNQAVQPQIVIRGLKFQIYQIYKIEGLYYLCSENKGADKLCGYRICENQVFSGSGSFGLLNLPEVMSDINKCFQRQ